MTQCEAVILRGVNLWQTRCPVNSGSSAACDASGFQNRYLVERPLEWI